MLHKCSHGLLTNYTSDCPWREEICTITRYITLPLLDTVRLRSKSPKFFSAELQIPSLVLLTLYLFFTWLWKNDLEIYIKK